MDAELRRQTAALCRNKGCRGFTNLYPSKWKPNTVINPESGFCFSDWTAWELVATELEAGRVVSEIDLDIPAGKTGFVMKIPFSDGRLVYVKWMYGAGKIIGRSFHYDA